MLRYLYASIAVAVVAYIALRLTVGGFILPALDPRVAADTYFIVPGLMSAIVAAWALRPAIRAQTPFGPVFAVVAYPFVTGFLFAIGLTIFGGGVEDTLVQTFEGTFSELSSAPLWVIETVKLTIPFSVVAVFFLRRSDPPETMKKKGLATVDPYGN